MHKKMILILLIFIITLDLACPHRSDPVVDDEHLPSVVTVYQGDTAHLNCRIPCSTENDRTVAWVRKSKLHIVTINQITTYFDVRFSSLNKTSSDSLWWTLEIQNVTAQDEDNYECQVSPVPHNANQVVKRNVQLIVLEKP